MMIYKNTRFLIIIENKYNSIFQISVSLSYSSDMSENNERIWDNSDGLLGDYYGINSPVFWVFE